MTSQYWDAGQAHAYHEFQYHFPEKTLAGKTIIVAGGSGGLGAATVALLARVGAHLVVGDTASAEVREAYLAAAQKIVAPLAGIAVFPGDPARVAFENLNRETLLASLESNYVGRILSAKEIGAVMECSRSRTEKGKCQNTPAC
jgi:NADPH:quinone reductase-like Zn-dependent oxidoreductase